MMAVCALGFASSVQGQDYFDRYAPKIVPNTEGEATLPDEPAEVEGDTTVLVDELKALVFVDHPDKVVQDELTEAQYPRGVHIGSDSRLPLLRSGAFQRTMTPYLGQPVSLYNLNALVRDIILFYRRNDRPVVDVSIPQQNIKGGVIQLVVVEGRVGQVEVRGARWFDPYMLLRQTRSARRSDIRESVLLEDLEWLNRNPFRTLDLELEPGEQFGETDIVFNVNDRFPMRVYTGYEDTGTRQTDLERLLFGFNYGNVLGRDHQLGYQYTASPDFTTLTAHSAIYSMAMPSRDLVSIFGTYGEVQSDVAPFETDGHAWQVSGRYQYNLCDWRCWERRLIAGIDFKQTNTNLDFGGVSVFGGNADIAQLILGYQASRTDGYGASSLGAEFVTSPGGFNSNNNDVSFNVIRPGATADYFYTRGFLERQTRLAYGYTFVSRLTGQHAEGNLLPSEQLGFGGYGSVRGYDARLVNGDSGYLGNFELRTSPIMLWGTASQRDELQLLTFYDCGRSWLHTLQPGEERGYFLHGAGLGARYAWSDNIQARCDYAWQLNDVPGDSVHSRVHISAILAY